MTTLADYLAAGAAELGLTLSPEQVASFVRFAGELRKWNEKINLTALTDERDIAVKHFLDSLTILPLLGDAGKLLDIGSGGGFPSIPLKIVAPALQVISVDSIEKKINFQRHVARQLGLENFSPLAARGEDLARSYPGEFSSIVSRAFASIPKFARIAEPLLAPGGIMVAMKGSDGEAEAEASAKQLHELGLTLATIHSFLLPISREMRTLVVIRRSGE